jgi:SAM-dependent methyltransferase
MNDRSPSRQAEEARYRDAARASEGGGAARAAAHWRLARRLAMGAGGAMPAVLDVGCGAGAFLAAARRDGALVAGVEIDPRAAAAARARGLEVVPGSILEVAPPAGPWDLVTFWDVLDQVDDPLGALRAVVPLLAPGGLLLARGRNGTLHAMLKRAALRVRGVVPWFPDPAVVHRWGFGRRAWRAVLGRAGLGGIVVRPAGPRIGRLAASMLATGRKPRAAGLPDDRFGRTRRLFG